MKKIGIVGLGLIGGSILKRLSNNKKFEIFCCSNSSFDMAQKYCKIASCDINIVAKCDIVFVCSEASKTLDVLDKLNEILDSKTIVVDVASIKSKLLNRKYNFDFMLSHPMAGSEKSGFISSDENLFNDCKWLIEKENALLLEIIKDLGAKPIVIDMKNHDNLCAQISHLPTILSFLLFKNAQNEALKIASSGFRDSTRLAMTSSDLAFSMFNQNYENILTAFDGLINELNNLKNLSDDEKIKLFNEIATKRAKMYDNNGKNAF